MPTVFKPQLDPRQRPDAPRTPNDRPPGENDNGSGRRPPTDKRTGGNGEGDNWNDRPVGARGPRERLIQTRIGLGSALAGDMMFFVAIISAVNRSEDDKSAHPLPPPPLLIRVPLVSPPETTTSRPPLLIVSPARYVVMVSKSE